MFEKFLPFIFHMSKLNVKFSFLFACSRHVMNPVFSFRGATGGGGLLGCSPTNTKNRNLKSGFVDIMLSNLFSDFPSAEINH
jgi:hypothetical protein